jgi:hypothetical protein
MTNVKRSSHTNISYHHKKWCAVNYVNVGPLERCDPGVHVYKCGPNKMTWLTHVSVGPGLLVQYVYLAATYADWDM